MEIIQKNEKMMDPNFVDLNKILYSMFEKKWLIIFVSILVCGLSMLYAFVRPTNYQATVLLQVSNKQASSLDSTEAATDEPISAQIALIRSKFILASVIDEVKSKNLTQLEKSEAIKQLKNKLLISDLTGLATNFPNKPAILQLSLVDKNPNKAMEVVNKIALITQEKDIQRKSLAASNTLSFLKKQLTISAAELKASEEKLNHYRLVTGKINIKLQTQNLLNYLSELDKQLELVKIKKMDLALRYTDNHPFVIALNEKFKQLKKQRTNVFTQIKSLTATDQTINNLQRDASAKNKFYMMLLNKIHQQEIITAGIASDINILAFATFSNVLSPLKFKTICLLGLFLGFLLACVGVFIWQLFVQRKQLFLLRQDFVDQNLINIPVAKKSVVD